MAAVEAKLSLPQNLYLEVTNRCNLKCRACILFRGSWEPPRDMTCAELIRITDQLPDLKRVALHGIGEPLLNSALPAIIRHLKDRNIHVLFNTNGILLDDKKQNELITAGLDELRVSLDAASAQTYRVMRNSEKFDRIVDNLQSLVRRIHCLRASAPKLSLWYLGTRENISELPEFVQLAAFVGVKEVYLQRLVYFQDDPGYGIATADKTLMEADAAARQYIRRGQNLAKRLGIEFSASGLASPLESIRPDSAKRSAWQKCLRPRMLMYITANGNVLPCCLSPFSVADYPAIILGNAFESTLESIWRGSRYRQFRKTHQSDTPPGCCRGCGTLWSL
jgi:radical SAM protein with 4Fe4S-binding SPASM domain